VLLLVLLVPLLLLLSFSSCYWPWCGAFSAWQPALDEYVSVRGVMALDTPGSIVTLWYVPPEEGCADKDGLMRCLPTAI
jgi:hypothetical protein